MPESRTESFNQLARLQRVITIAALTLAVSWGAWAYLAQWHVLGVVGLAVIFAGHAVVLALEFVLMARVNATDPAPTATFGQYLRAWYGEVLHAPKVFCWLQPFRSNLHADHLPAASTRRGVLLVHGFFCNRGLWNDWLARLTQLGHPCVAVNLGPVFGSIDDYLQAIEAAVLKLEAATGQPPVIVAHSMGGLVARKWWAGTHDAHRVHRLLTLGTPHHGTWLARFAPSTNARQMRIGSRWLQSLQATEPAHHVTRMVCFYSHCDNIVFPASTATLHGAHSWHLTGVSHVHMVQREEPFEELLRQLSQARPSVLL